MLKKRFSLPGKHSIQTKFDLKGGVWQMCQSSKQVKNIKTLGSSITWMSCGYFHTPVHIITCYLSCNNEVAPQVKESVQRLKHLITSIFETHAHSRVIVMGDFNTRWKEEVRAFMKQKGLIRVVNESEPTHQLGNQIDQIFSNLPIIAHSVQDIEFSDHKAIIADFDLKINKNDLNLKQQKEVISQGDLIKAATSSDTVQRIIDSPYILNQPLKQHFSEILKPRKKYSHWYQKPPKWYLEQSAPDPEQNKQIKQSQWNKLLIDINEAHTNRNFKLFHKLVKRAAQIKNSGAPIAGIVTGTEEVLDEDELSKAVVDYYSRLFGSLDRIHVPQTENAAMPDNRLTFTIAEVHMAIDECNFNKGIGSDGFDGTILRDPKAKEAVALFIVDTLNSKRLPSYLKEGRLALLSKLISQNKIPLEETRPIVVNSHLHKILEMTVSNKIKVTSSKLLQVGSYQTGFKEDCSTHINSSKLLKTILQSKRNKRHKQAFILVDLKKAYDSVNRAKLIEILRKRATNEFECQLVEIIENLLTNTTLNYKGYVFETLKGVVQGSILSPWLFNVYLDEALNSNPSLRKLIKSGQLLAFAVDILVRVPSEIQFKEAIEAFESLEREFGLALNKSKTTYLTENSQMLKERIAGIKRSDKAKYLGLPISLSRKALLEDCKSKVKQLAGLMKSRLTKLEPEVIGAVFTTYIRSLLIFFISPLLVENIIKAYQISKFEALLRREMLHISRDIKSKVILNTTSQYNRSTTKVVKSLADKVRLQATRQTELKYEVKQEIEETTRSRRSLYLSRGSLDLMLALTHAVPSQDMAGPTSAKSINVLQTDAISMNAATQRGLATSQGLTRHWKRKTYLKQIAYFKSRWWSLSSSFDEGWRNQLKTVSWRRGKQLRQVKSEKTHREDSRQINNNGGRLRPARQHELKSDA